NLLDGSWFLSSLVGFGDSPKRITVARLFVRPFVIYRNNDALPSAKLPIPTLLALPHCPNINASSPPLPWSWLRGGLGAVFGSSFKRHGRDTAEELGRGIRRSIDDYRHRYGWNTY
ncbi:MAG: hypothetical protein PHH87_11060, partial [Desulfuromonas sp.]|nr:hypothetical protein [Desulfuromonas sp.]